MSVFKYIVCVVMQVPCCVQVYVTCDSTVECKGCVGAYVARKALMMMCNLPQWCIRRLKRLVVLWGVDFG